MSQAVGAFWGWVDSKGAGLLGFVARHKRVFQLAYVSVRTAIFHNSQGRRSILSVILAQVYYTGYEALPLVSVLALALGGVVILNASALSFLADIKMIAQLLVVIVVRELGPLMIALILIARSGTAIAAEIGNMKINREIDALKIMAINPLTYIVYPRLVGGVVSIVCLAFYFNAVALVGGFAVSRLMHSIPFSSYFNALTEVLTVRDVALFLTKNVLNGVTIFAICCDQGLQVIESPHEVPQATTRAVIQSIAAIGVITFLATAVFYFGPLVPWKEILTLE
jgi:phospholipid/cholesterol/gamma-HCH transport system permease protein